MQIPVLDHGYVKLINSMGSDVDVVNSARASFEKEVDTLSEQDTNLIKFLIKDKHDSTLRHCAVTLEFYAPLMCARQIYKHVVGSSHLDDQMGWNESSRRYITENEVFYIPTPTQWRSTPENKKQGSGEPLSASEGAKYYMRMQKAVETGLEAYRDALSDGVAPEQARLLLPAYAMYVRWRWTSSLNALLHFLSLRLDNHTQYETREYAKAVNEIVSELYPVTVQFWNEYRI